jgi:broad specificity phosphatase PhoE
VSALQHEEASMSWQQSTVAPAGTHHLVDGRPLYTARFDAVLPFHGPGLAPVSDASGAYHIDHRGEPAYARRFERTFGFYGGRSAVFTRDGWQHILADGVPLSPRTWSWCGNFQSSRCPVRDVHGRYVHIDQDGNPVSQRTWRYAGDYREGAAVVQRDDGLHGHVDLEGQPLHPLWFLDLDVFHKGFARARDRGGWLHVDRLGRPIYHRRFAAVEPFYNGQARVERFGGRLEIIDEQGATLHELRPTLPDTSGRPRHADDRVAIPWLLPETMIATLEGLPTDRPVALLMRHGPRFDLEPGRAGLDVTLLPEGEPLVRHLGKMMRGRLVSLTSSPVLRCVQTAELLADGADVTLPIPTDELLGMPGAYVADTRLAGPAFRDEPYFDLMRRLCSSQPPPPGFHDPLEATRRLLAMMLEPAAPGLHAFVSHDSIVGIAMAHLTGRFPQPWVRCLETGFAWREGDSVVVCYQGHRVEVEP